MAAKDRRSLLGISSLWSLFKICRAEAADNKSATEAKGDQRLTNPFGVFLSLWSLFIKRSPVKATLVLWEF